MNTDEEFETSFGDNDNQNDKKNNSNSKNNKNANASSSSSNNRVGGSAVNKSSKSLIDAYATYVSQDGILGLSVGGWLKKSLEEAEQEYPGIVVGTDTKLSYKDAHASASGALIQIDPRTGACSVFHKRHAIPQCLGCWQPLIVSGEEVQTLSCGHTFHDRCNVNSECAFCHSTFHTGEWIEQKGYPLKERVDKLRVTAKCVGVLEFRPNDNFTYFASSLLQIVDSVAGKGERTLVRSLGSTLSLVGSPIFLPVRVVLFDFDLTLTRLHVFGKFFGPRSGAKSVNQGLRFLQAEHTRKESLIAKVMTDATMKNFEKFVKAAHARNMLVFIATNGVKRGVEFILKAVMPETFSLISEVVTPAVFGVDEGIDIGDNKNMMTQYVMHKCNGSFAESILVDDTIGNCIQFAFNGGRVIHCEREGLSDVEFAHLNKMCRT